MSPFGLGSLPRSWAAWCPHQAFGLCDSICVLMLTLSTPLPGFGPVSLRSSRSLPSVSCLVLYPYQGFLRRCKRSIVGLDPRSLCRPLTSVKSPWSFPIGSSSLAALGRRLEARGLCSAANFCSDLGGCSATFSFSGCHVPRSRVLPGISLLGVP